MECGEWKWWLLDQRYEMWTKDVDSGTGRWWKGTRELKGVGSVE